MQISNVHYSSRRVLTVTLLTTGLATSVAMADAGLRPLTGSYATLVNQGKCVDTQGSRTTNGAPLILWDCNGSHTQEWTYDERTLSLQNRAAGKCIDVEERGGRREGSTLILWDCDGTRGQQWEHQGYRGSDNIRGFGGNCMATESGGNKNGTYLVMSLCNSRASQQFWGQESSSTPARKVADRAEVCLYELTDYKGWKKCLSADQADFADLKINDSVSSLTITGNLKVKLYTDADYRGVERIYTQDVSWVGDAVNNKFSSLRVEKLGADRLPTDSSSSAKRDRYAEIAEAIRRGQAGTNTGSYPSQKGIENRGATEFFTVVNRSGKCLDVYQSDFEGRLNGSRVQVWDCNTQANQDWKIDDFGHLLSRNGKCLGVSADQMGQNGAKVLVWNCQNNASQQWTLDKGRLFLPASNKCLDLDSGTMNQNGGKVQLWDCHDRSNQQWTIAYRPATGAIPEGPRQSPPASKYPDRALQEFFRFTSGGRCLDIHRADFDAGRNGGKVQVWECHEGINQDWKFDNRGRLLTKNDKCLDIAPEGMNQNGTPLQIRECGNRLTQQWDLDDGRLRNRAANKCIDLDSGTMDRNGGKVQIWECHGRGNQQWAIMYH